MAGNSITELSTSVNCIVPLRYSDIPFLSLPSKLTRNTGKALVWADIRSISDWTGNNKAITTATRIFLLTVLIEVWFINNPFKSYFSVIAAIVVIICIVSIVSPVRIV